MTILGIPDDSQFNDNTLRDLTEIDTTQSARINRFLDVPSWICSCKITNFGRNKRCANWRCRQLRPTDYVEPPL